MKPRFIRRTILPFCFAIAWCLVLFSSNFDSKGSTALSMAYVHADDRPIATAIAQVPPAVPVRTETVQYATVNGKSVSGFLARPEAVTGPLPGIIAIHEWWGLNDNIRAIASRLAGEGYAVLAVDLYNGESAETPDGARALSSSVQDNPDSARDNLRQAYAYLEGSGSLTVGTVGWCFGGAWSLQTALMFPDRVDATVIYYGRLVTDADALVPLQMPILGLFGELDQGIPPSTVREFEAALQAAGKDAQIVIYENAGHAFANPSGTRYQREAAEDAWERTTTFFAEHLK
ncbi:dienelactone hydrolase family protein [Rubidibacter lacunae]|nr:dienelactone hydrolase family protein [Rubidibacter lacunae]